MFLIIDARYSTDYKKEIFESHRRSMSRCNFVACLTDTKNGKYEVLKERYGKYKVGDTINEAQVFDHCWYIMGMNRTI